jgi:hypothetical protein
MEAKSAARFDPRYQLHLKHPKLKRLQPETIEAYARAIRRIGACFDGQIDAPTEQQLLDDFTESHSWSAVKLDDFSTFRGEQRLKGAEIRRRKRADRRSGRSSRPS